MKTAMQELIEQLEKTIPEINNGNAIEKYFWLEKEKQQIIEAFQTGDFENTKVYTSEQYYNETYENNL